MAFDTQKFDPQGQGTKGNIKVATYVTSDTLAQVLAASYFANALVYGTMAVGDPMIVKASDGIATVKFTAVASTGVTVVPLAPSELVTLGATGTNIPAGGVAYLPGTGANEYLLAAPTPGAEITLIKNTTATASLIVLPLATDAVIGFTGSRKLTFLGRDQTITLKAISASRWIVKSAYPHTSDGVWAGTVGAS